MSFWCLQFSQKRMKNNSTWGTIVAKSIFFVHFWGELKIPKRHFKINWPLTETVYYLRLYGMYYDFTAEYLMILSQCAKSVVRKERVFSVNILSRIRKHPFISPICAYGPHFLSWISGVVPFNTWLISSWEKKCCSKLSKCTKCHLFPLKWSKLSYL